MQGVFTQPLHAATVDEVLAALNTSRSGLVSDEVQRRQQQFGANALAQAPPPSRWRLLAAQFRSAVVLLLIAAALVSGALGEWIDALAIIAIVLLNGVLGFLQEDKSRRALEALRNMSSPSARVMRDGAQQTIAARDLVPGDRIEVEAGDQVPADARLIDAVRLTVQEAALTGESVPVEKNATETIERKSPLADRRNMLYLGTTVSTGKGSAIVAATGMQTELGLIAGMIERETPEPTPLERRLDQLGRVLMLVCLGLVAVVFALEMWRGGQWIEVFLTAVSLAVASVPEGLPAVVTLALALGLERMVRRNALVRKLPSVETLGAVTVICTDKTGTLTRNEMTVREIVTGTARYRVTGSGFDPRGKFMKYAVSEGMSGNGGQSVSDVRNELDLFETLTVAAGCTTAQLQPPPEEGAAWHVIGDPTEGALLVAGRKAGVDLSRVTVVHEIPFDSERKMMSRVLAFDGRQRMVVKGAAEVILENCSGELYSGSVRSLSDERRKELLAQVDGIARRAMRVLAAAARDFPTDHRGPYEEEELTFCGLLAMQDPPREEAKEAVARCLRAGIRPVMITGDHPATAAAIGAELGFGDSVEALTGLELDELSAEQLAAKVMHVGVYARVSAEHKRRIVHALKSCGEIVAMTGDGVNDAPAITAADIGIGMGITGTDVTKAAADMVLTDDNFATIVNAVEEGRGIFDNIQKVVLYLLACNSGEVLIMFAAALIDWPNPLLPIHLLWINLITDGLPALTLGVERPAPDTMSRPPRPPREPVITRARGKKILGYGVLFALSIGLGFAYVRWQAGGTDETARTVAFCIACYSQMCFAFGCRSDRFTFPQLGILSNATMFAAIMFSGTLQLGTVLLPWGRTIFQTTALSWDQWLAVSLLSLVPVTVLELRKITRAWSAHR